MVLRNSKLVSCSSQQIERNIAKRDKLPFRSVGGLGQIVIYAANFFTLLLCLRGMYCDSYCILHILASYDIS